jgi:ABC-type uncharacterized transport system auxiliary subunit
MRPAAGIAAASLAASALLALAGCLPQLVPEVPPPPQSYDFGPLPDDAPARLRVRVRLESVDAPSWLAGPEIRYRRLDEQPQALRAYARSQWIAAVPELFEQRLRHRLTQASAADGRELFLRLEILSFEQVFTGADETHVSLRARARLEDGREPARQQEISLRRPSAPDARGATRELPVLADQAIEGVIEWLRQVTLDWHES